MSLTLTGTAPRASSVLNAPRDLQTAARPTSRELLTAEPRTIVRLRSLRLATAEHAEQFVDSTERRHAVAELVSASMPVEGEEEIPKRGLTIIVSTTRQMRKVRKQHLSHCQRMLLSDSMQVHRVLRRAVPNVPPPPAPLRGLQSQRYRVL